MAIENVPRTLVYRDFKTVADILGSGSERTLEQEFYDRFIKRKFIENLENPPKCICTIFNNARYIYYLIYNEEENDPSLCFNVYLAKAAEVTEGTELKSHITAATMALVYNWLKQRLHENRKYYPELKDESFIHFDERKEENVTKLCEKINLHFSKEEKEVTAENIKIFHDLKMEKSDLPTDIDTLFNDLRGIEEAASNAPILDVAKGIDYLMEFYDSPNGTNGERYLFLTNILKRLENETSLESDSKEIEIAKMTINKELQRLETAPEPKPFSLGLSLDNIISIPIEEEKELPSEMRDHIGWINDSSKASVIIKTLKKHMTGKKLTKPKQVLMPLCAALEAGIITKPTWEDYKIIFKEFVFKSETSLNTWVDAEGVKSYRKYKKTSNSFNQLIKLFKEIGE